MRNIALSIFILFSLLLASTANQKAKQRRVRREKSTLPPNATTVYTKHDDIAHFTCTVRLQATISWKRERRDVTNDDLGIAILSLKNGGSLESHLFVAVTADDLRGKYECFSSDDPDVAMQTFLIKNDPALEGMLSDTDKWAIGLSLSISIFLVIAILYFLWRGNRRLKKGRAEDAAARSRARNNHNGALENLAVEEEIVEIGENCAKEKEIANGIKKEPVTKNKEKTEENGNNNKPIELRSGTQPQPVVHEVTVESAPEKEKSTQF